MMAPRQLLLIVLAFLAISEVSTSSSSSNNWRRWRRCRNLPSLLNGKITRNGLNTIDYECNPGYKLAITATCQRGRYWTPRVTCEEILCEGEPVIAANSSRDGDITSRQPGAEYNFTCDPGFKIEMGKVVCDESGKWNVDEVECTEILCEGEPVIAANSSLDGEITSRQPGAEYNVTCDPGFRDGMGKVVCDESGKWNVDEVECTECFALVDNFIRHIKAESVAIDEPSCNELCANDTTCGSLFFGTRNCVRFLSPVTNASRESTLDDCIAACNENDECKVSAYVNRTTVCLLTNSVNLTFTPVAGTTTVEKNCPL